MKKKKTEAQTLLRPPIVAVLGHVDHGKTTLLDTIRKTHVAAHEYGGITQHIGAYQIHNITFIDTPGHEAFAKMRSRGAHVADIALLVVAADDSVMPQTKESIEQIKASGASMIVVMNKIDLPTAMPDKVKSDLAKNGVQVEGFGGDIPVALVSAKTGKGVPELLELISLVAQMKGLDFAPEAPLEAVVIETRLDKGKGMVATVIVKKGTLKFGTLLFEGAKQVARVRAMFDEYGKAVAQAGPARPVEVLGFTTLPVVGSVLRTDIYLEQKPQEAVVQNAPFTAENLPDWLKPVAEQEGRKLTVILKVDTAGSLEAIIAALPKQIELVTAGIGDINEADVLTAKSAKAIIVGFNVKCSPSVEKLAIAEKVVFRIYSIIYELLDELTEVVSGLKEVLAVERELGTGTVIAEFPFEKSRIAGTKLVSGRLARGDTVKIMRAEAEIARARIKSVRRGKEDTTKVDKVGVECGILFDKKVDFALQDAIIAITT
ncbi:MAG: translation initiation factor IF-2 [Candidatus Gottesmanbacteria bacterium]|nr:translation initiation factor IF-2 [Candidatus Gottesmanbacteria bacterium]